MLSVVFLVVTLCVVKLCVVMMNIIMLSVTVTLLHKDTEAVFLVVCDPSMNEL
jgi:hypothetical protein